LPYNGPLLRGVNVRIEGMCSYVMIMKFTKINEVNNKPRNEGNWWRDNKNNIAIMY